jgi:hypothetical protein
MSSTKPITAIDASSTQEVVVDDTSTVVNSSESKTIATSDTTNDAKTPSSTESVQADTPVAPPLDLELKHNWSLDRVDEFHASIQLNYRFDDFSPLIPHSRRSDPEKVQVRSKLMFRMNHINEHGEDKLKSTLPEKMNLSSHSATIYAQGDLGSCVAQAICAGIQLRNRKINNDQSLLSRFTRGSAVPEFSPSRLALYWHARIEEGLPSNVDTGSTIHSGILSVEKFKLFDESLWPYDVSKYAVEPPLLTALEAIRYNSVEYSKIQNNTLMLKHMISTGFPVACGIVVYHSMMSHGVLVTGTVPMPSGKETCLGGHAILLVGYDDASSTFIFQNSWGSIWGDRGYGRLSYDYITKYGADFWAIEKFA